MRGDARAATFARIRHAAAEHGITITLCACKNPDLAGGTCNIAGSSPRRATDDRRPALL
jgi:hypothetical protein